jgi:release factor glutamine methyltransferase
MNRKEAYELGIKTLTEAGIEEAKSDTLLLLEGVCHVTRNDVLVHGEALLEEAVADAYMAALQKRCTHIPVQHITGVQNFMGLDFTVNEHVLIPRFDTEILVEEVMKYLHDGFSILDMCTGSGCILLSLLKYSNNCKGLGVDISADALVIANMNKEKLGIEASFIESNLIEQVEGKYDIIVSNPPYIRSDVIPTLMKEVREHEPVLALDGTKDGLFFYREIVKESPAYLNGGGMLFFEIGYDQAEEVRHLMEEAGFKDVTVVKDFAGLDRVVYGRR